MNITETKDGAIITITVKTNASKFSVAIDGEDIIVRSTEEPLKGKVNKEILKELSRLFCTKAELVRGSTSRQKQILLQNISKSQVEMQLDRPKTP